MATQIIRTDADSTETLTLVQTNAGQILIQIESGPPDTDGDFVGLYTLDGDEVRMGDNTDWTAIDAADVGLDAAEIASEWETGNSSCEVA